MRLLLDTHTFLWFIGGEAQFSAYARQLIENPANQRWLSIGSLWEIAIKISIGKLEPYREFDELFLHHLELNDIALLPVSPSHLTVIATIPQHHRDPFDRLIIAQAQVEQIPIVGADTAFDAYGITRLW